MTGGRIYIIDDDGAVRLVLNRYLTTLGYDVQEFASAEEFLQDGDFQSPACAILDLRMRGISGLQLMDHLQQLQSPIKCVLLTGHADVSSAVVAMRKGAMNFLEKPCEMSTMREAVEQALTQSKTLKSRGENALRESFNQLAPAEQEVFRCIITGLTNEKIAEKLDVSRRTVQLRSSSLMRKLGIKSRPELVRQAWLAGFMPNDGGSSPET